MKIICINGQIYKSEMYVQNNNSKSMKITEIWEFYGYSADYKAYQNTY